MTLAGLVQSRRWHFHDREGTRILWQGAELVKYPKVVVPQVGSLLKLVPWLLLTCLMAAVLWRTQALAGASLFQSDVPTPTEVASPTPEVPTPTTAPVTPTLTVAPVSTETLPTVTPMVPPTPTPEPPTAAPTATATMAPQRVATRSPAPISDEAQRYPDEEANLRFRWRTLFDSLALGVSYLWLVCGVGLVALLVLLLVVFWLKGRRSGPGS
jgi:hypothetical protein